MFARREGHVALFSAGGHNVVSLDLDNKGTPSFDVGLYDDSGLLLAKIEENLPVALGPNLCVKRPDLSTLLVEQRRLFQRPKELLFFHYLNPDVFRIRGIFSYRGHPTLTVTEDALKVTGGPANGSSVQIGCFDYEPTTQGGTIFGF